MIVYQEIKKLQQKQLMPGEKFEVDGAVLQELIGHRTQLQDENNELRNELRRMESW